MGRLHLSSTSFGLVLVGTAFGGWLREIVVAIVAAVVLAAVIMLLKPLRLMLIDRLQSRRVRVSAAARRRGVERVYAARSANQAPNLATRKDAFDLQAMIQGGLIIQAERGHGRIVMIGVALVDILHAPGDFLPRLGEALARSAGQVQLSVVVLDPSCSEAIRRSNLEKHGKTPNDIRASGEHFKLYFADLPNAHFGTYTIRPWAFVMITDEWALVQRYVQAPRATVKGFCFGDNQPVFVYRGGSEYYLDLIAEVTEFFRSDVNWVEGGPPAFV